MLAARVKEVVGMAMIGDGVVALIEPSRHARLWQSGPRAYSDALGYLARHPGLVRAMAVAEVALGLWLVKRQLRPVDRLPRS